MDAKAFGEIIEKACRPASFPLGVKLAKPGETPPAKHKRPLSGLGKRFAACQAITLARTYGWTLVMEPEDHGCPLAKVFLGHFPADRFLKGELGLLYQEDINVCQEMEATFPRREVGEVEATWLAPLSKCEFEPDVALLYATPAQIVPLIQAANYGVGTGVASTSAGRGGCAAWIAGVQKSGRSTYLIPGPGERVFAGVQDHEMAFAIPRNEFSRIAEGLDFVRSTGAFKFPVTNLMLLAEPKMPPSYYGIDPANDE